MAEVVTVGLVANCARRVLPRGRADEPYVALLLRRHSSPRLVADSESPFNNAATGRVLLVVAAAVCIAVQSAFPKAPSTDALPLAAPVSVIASASGGSQVDTADDHRRYRYIAISGPKGMPDSTVLVIELRYLVRAGWHCDVVRTIRAKPRGETMELVARSCPLKALSDVTLSSPDGALRVDLTPVSSPADAAQQADATSLEGNSAINQALTANRPILWAMMQDET